MKMFSNSAVINVSILFINSKAVDSCRVCVCVFVPFFSSFPNTRVQVDGVGKVLKKSEILLFTRIAQSSQIYFD